MYVLIAVIYNNENIVGYRLIDEDNFNVKDVYTINDVLYLEDRNLLKGLKVVDNKVVISIGGLDRYPKIKNGNIEDKHIITILKRVYKGSDLVGYIVSDWNGRVRLARKEDVIRYGLKYKISNAVIKTRENVRFISSLKGSFPISKIEDNDNSNNLGKRVYNIGGRHYKTLEVDNLIVDKQNEGVRYNREEILSGFDNLNNLNELDLSRSGSEDIWKSFNKILISEVSMSKKAKYSGSSVKELDISNIRYIKDSFVDMSSIENMRICGNIKKIKSSIYNLSNLRKLSLKGFDLGNCRGSFCDLPSLRDLEIDNCITSIGTDNFCNIGINKLDLSMCKNLRHIGDKNFMDCTRISKLILPEGLEYIGEYCFYRCPNLKEVYIPNSVDHIGSNSFNGVTLKFREGKEVIKKEAICGGIYKNIVLPSTLKSIENNALNSFRVYEKFNLPENLSYIGSNNFKDCVFDRGLDLSKCNNLQTIEGEVFNNIDTTYVILPEGLKSINSRCFCNSIIDFIVLPKSLNKISETSFKYSKKTRVFYVYKNSYAAKFCKKHRYNYLEISSLNDLPFLNNRVDKGETAKYIMTLSRHKLHKKLLEPEYRDNIDKIYRIYSKVTKKYIDNSSLVRLNTDKLIDFPLNKIKLLNDIIVKEREKLSDENPYLSIYNKDNLSTRFKVLCNYITYTLDFTNLPFTTNSLRYLDSIRDDIEYYVVYIDRDSAVISLVVNVPESDGKCYYSNMIVVIVIGDSIKFVSILDYNGDDKFYRNMVKDLSYKGLLRGTVTDQFKPGDVIFEDKYTINNMKIPLYVWKNVINSLYDHLIVIGSNDSPNSIMCLDLENGVILELVGSGALYKIGNEDYIVKNISHISHVKNISIPKPNVNKAMEMYKYTTYKDEYTEYMASLDGAYDNKASYEWVLVNKFKKEGIDNVLDIEKLDRKHIECILKTAFFKEVSITQSKLSTKSYNRRLYELSDGTELAEYNVTDMDYIKVLRDKASYAYYINGDKLNRRLRVYLTTASIRSIWNLLSSLESREGNRGLRLNEGIFRGDISDNYWVYYKITDRNDGRYVYYYGVNLENGGVYLLGERYLDYSYVELFRFNSIEDTMLFNNMVYIHDLNDLMDDIFNKTRKHNLTKIRDYVLKGYPNNHFVPLDMDNIWNLVAKQPRKNQ